MKILMLGSGSYKSSLSFRIIALGQALAKKGHDIAIMLPSADKYNDFTPDPHAAVPGVGLLQPWQLHTRSSMINLFPYLLTSLFGILRARPQLVYLYKPTPITILGLLPKFLMRTPVVLDLDDLGSEVMRGQGQSGVQVRLVAWCERMAVRHASAVVVASHYLEKLVHEQYPDKPVLVLSNGVDPVAYAVRSAEKPRRAIYYFGALNRLSLIADVLRALPQTLRAIPDAQVYILGGGSALKEAQRLAHELGVGHAVTFTGWIDMFTAPEYGQFADVAVCYQPDTSTVRAASNMKVFQYMAMGMVPVVSDVGDLRRYIEDGQAGVAVAPDDPAALAGAMIDLLTDDTRRVALAQQARKLAETMYSWDSLAEELDRFITGQCAASNAQIAGETR